MAFEDSIIRLKRIDYLIRLKSTGTPKKLSEKLNISERWVYEYITILKELGAPIRYSKIRKSYVYEEDGQFLVEFKKNIK